MRLKREYLFFFKQKPAYEMRISDGSSDVCSSNHYAQIPPETIAANLINTAGTLRLAGIFPVIIAPYKVSADCQNFKFLNKRLTDAARYLEHLADRKSTRLNSSH